MSDQKQPLPVLDQEIEAPMTEVHLSIIRACGRGAKTEDVVRVIDSLKTGKGSRLIAFHRGDSSVGLPGDHASIDLDLSGYNMADAADILGRAKALLQAAFSELWDARATVVTDVDIAV